MPAKRRFHFSFSEFLLIILLICSGVMLTWSSGKFFISFNKLGFSIISTMENGVNATIKGISNTFTAIHELTVLREENKTLKKKVLELQYFQRDNVEIRNENTRLKELLGFSDDQKYKNYPANIIARDMSSPYNTLTINKGVHSGIRKNMPVIAIQNGNIGLVGKIISVGTFTSMVMPLYDANCNVSARIKTMRDLGLVKGLGSADNPLEMDYIRKRVINSLHYGDTVVTSGENDNYYKDIPIGTIKKIIVNDYNSSLDIELTPVIDFSRLETVTVVDMEESNNKKVYKTK